MKNTQQIKMDEELDLYNDILINDSMDGRAASLEEVICKADSFVFYAYVKLFDKILV